MIYETDRTLKDLIKQIAQNGSLAIAESSTVPNQAEEIGENDRIFSSMNHYNEKACKCQWCRQKLNRAERLQRAQQIKPVWEK